MRIHKIQNDKKNSKFFSLVLLAIIVILPMIHSTAHAEEKQTSAVKNMIVGKTVNKTVNVVNEKNKLVQEDLIIAGISQAMSKESMIAILGKTTSTEELTLDYFAGGKNVKFTKFNYPGISVTVLDIKDGVMQVDITDTSYKTARGIKIGDTLTKLKELYGDEDQHSPSKMGDPFFVYRKAESPESLTFKIDPKTNLIIRISVDSWGA